MQTTCSGRLTRYIGTGVVKVSQQRKQLKPGLLSGTCAADRSSTPHTFRGVISSLCSTCRVVVDSTNVHSARPKCVCACMLSCRFGDRDGIGSDALLQHPLALCAAADGSVVYIADSYNHRIKALDTRTNEVTTIAGKHAFTRSAPAMSSPHLHVIPWLT